MKLHNLRDVLQHELKDLYSAEKLLLRALETLRDKASTDALKQAYAHHLEKTRGHLTRLEEVGQLLDMRLGGHRCEAMDGIIEEGEEILKMDATPEARDAALIAASQRVEHYEIAAYGSARTFARMLGEDKAAALLEQTLQEEEEADRKLSALAEQNVNRAAMAAHT